MMARLPMLTRGDRAYRHEKIVAAYQRGLSSRAVASAFGMSGGHVRSIIREAGVSRPVGRPSA